MYRKDWISYHIFMFGFSFLFPFYKPFKYKIFTMKKFNFNDISLRTMLSSTLLFKTFLINEIFHFVYLQKKENIFHNCSRLLLHKWYENRSLSRVKCFVNLLTTPTSAFEIFLLYYGTPFAYCISIFLSAKAFSRRLQITRFQLIFHDFS